MTDEGLGGSSHSSGAVLRLLVTSVLSGRSTIHNGIQPKSFSGLILLQLSVRPPLMCDHSGRS